MANCRMDSTAFSIVNWTAVREARTNFYTPQFSIEGSVDQTPFFKKLFLENRESRDSQLKLRSMADWSAFQKAYDLFNHSGRVSARRYRAWRDANLFRCGPISSLERPSGLAIFSALLRKYADPEITHALVRTAMAYNEGASKRMAENSRLNGEFKINELHIYKQAVFNGTGLSQSQKSVWDGMNAYLRRDAIAATYRWFGESIPDLASGARIWRDPEIIKFLETYDRAAEFPAAVFARLGAGPMYTRLVTANLVDHGATPMLSRNGSRDEDKAILIKLLEDCRAVYLRPGLTYEQLLRHEFRVNKSE